MDKQASDDTRILYVTTGVLLRKLVGKKNMLEYTHVILDEVSDEKAYTHFNKNKKYDRFYGNLCLVYRWFDD